MNFSKNKKEIAKSRGKSEIFEKNIKNLKKRLAYFLFWYIIAKEYRISGTLFYIDIK